MELPAFTADGRARTEAIATLSVQPTPTSLVTYASHGRLLIVGAEYPPPDLIEQINHTNLVCHHLVNAQASDAQSLENLGAFSNVYQVDKYAITGHLGAFSVEVERGAKTMNLGQVAALKDGHFDLVLEFSAAPSIAAQVPPPGYYWMHRDLNDAAKLEHILEQIPNLVGNFEKPKYYSYDPDICAHQRSGITACTRCIDVCPTDAIISIGEQIEVSPYLCQGGGSCATACPTGAIVYAYPSAGNLLEILRHLIIQYLQTGGSEPHILFYDKEIGGPIVQESISLLRENILPIEIEEIGSVGLDVLFGTLSYGASTVTIVCEGIPQSAFNELKAQLQILEAMLIGLGYEETPIELLTVDSAQQLTDPLRKLPSDLNIAGAKFMPSGIKRTDIRMALEHLHQQSPLKPSYVDLPAHAPFGEIHVNTSTCTLCMGCVSICPAAALEAGGDTPKLSFIENNCVQCGMCETACPEASISRSQRYIFAADARLRSRTLNEDSPFQCVQCGKPFATNVILNRMKEKLKGHWMFADNAEAMARLEMCEDCRVKDMFVAERRKFES